METTRPLIVVVAGPNGAGKSTSAPLLLREALAVSEFVNADSIAVGLSGLHPESVSLAAGRLMLTRIRTLADERASFAFETTLASKTFEPWLRRLREGGYRVHLAFFALPTPELAVARVAERVRDGGHDVPVDVIRRRFRAGLRNLFGSYIRVADSWQLIDNSGASGPRSIATGVNERPPVIFDLDCWSRLVETASA